MKGVRTLADKNVFKESNYYKGRHFHGQLHFNCDSKTGSRKREDHGNGMARIRSEQLDIGRDKRRINLFKGSNITHTSSQRSATSIIKEFITIANEQN